MTDLNAANHPLSELDAEALAWFSRTGRGPQADQDADLQAWLRVDPARRRAFARWQAEWQALDSLPLAGVEQLRKQLAADKAVMAASDAASIAVSAAPAAPPSAMPSYVPSPTPSSSPPTSAERRRWMRGLSAMVPQAAVVLMMLSVSGGAYLGWDYWQQQPVYAHSFATQRGEQLDIHLPDGSRLRLDTATRIAVTLYRQRREVTLAEGQVVFQVQGDAARPFDVLAGPMQVTVVGTRFSVRHTAGISGDDGVRVAVEEGRVRVRRALPAGKTSTAAAADGHGIELVAGQQVTADSAGELAPVAAVGAAGIAPWRDGRITFDNTPLAQALAEFERYGRTGLMVRDPAVAGLRLTGTFDPQRLGNFLLALPKVLPVRLRTDGANTEIVASR